MRKQRCKFEFTFQSELLFTTAMHVRSRANRLIRRNFTFTFDASNAYCWSIQSASSSSTEHAGRYPERTLMKERITIYDLRVTTTEGSITEGWLVRKTSGATPFQLERRRQFSSERLGVALLLLLGFCDIERNEKIDGSRNSLRMTRPRDEKDDIDPGRHCGNIKKP